MTVKEDDSLELMRSQDLVQVKCVMPAGYDWEYLINKRNCELAASFGIFTYRIFFFVLIFSYHLGFSFLGILIWYKICSTVGP
jgi:hypothetical protein